MPPKDILALRLPPISQSAVIVHAWLFIYNPSDLLFMDNYLCAHSAIVAHVYDVNWMAVVHVYDRSRYELIELCDVNTKW